MTTEKWDDIKTMIQDKFEVLENKVEPVELKTGLDEKQKIGDKQVLIFISPMGKVKLEFATKPVILDKKEHYSKRMGIASKTEYVLSEDEFTHRLDAYLEKEGEWEKIDPTTFEN